jgi:hypothetical protein
VSPADRDEFRRMLALALQPMQEQIDALKLGTQRDSVIKGLRAEIADLQAVDRKHSGQHKQVTTELLPRMKSEVDLARGSDLSAIALAYERLAHVALDSNERLARLEEQGKKSSVEVQRTQGTTQAIQVAADSADTNSRLAKRWAKIASIVFLIAQAIWLGLIAALTRGAG